MLYLLLTGRMPYHVETGSTSELLKAICEQVPEKPSNHVPTTGQVMNSSGGYESMADPLLSSEPSSDTCTRRWHDNWLTLAEIATARFTTPARLRRILAGDLDAIVLMALHKEPAAAVYLSWPSLADDVHCYLEGLPVRAHPDSVSLSRG